MNDQRQCLPIIGCVQCLETFRRHGKRDGASISGTYCWYPGVKGGVAKFNLSGG